MSCCIIRCLSKTIKNTACRKAPQYFEARAPISRSMHLRQMSSIKKNTAAHGPPSQGCFWSGTILAAPNQRRHSGLGSVQLFRVFRAKKSQQDPRNNKTRHSQTQPPPRTSDTVSILRHCRCLSTSSLSQVVTGL
jgi:hypothetical protein